MDNLAMCNISNEYYNNEQFSNEQSINDQSCHVKSTNKQYNNLAMLNIAIGSKFPNWQSSTVMSRGEVKPVPGILKRPPGEGEMAPPGSQVSGGNGVGIRGVWVLEIVFESIQFWAPWTPNRVFEASNIAGKHPI